MNRKRWLTLGAVVLSAVVVFGVYKLRQFSRQPTYWQTTEATPQAAAQAEEFERRVPAEISRARGEGELWALDIKAAHVNQWLATRLPLWAANQGVELPSRLHRPMVAVEPGRLIVAWQVDEAADAQVVSAAFELTAPDGDGVVGLSLADVYVGRFRVSPDTAAAYIAGLDDTSAQQVAHWRALLEHLPLRLTLPDGRVVTATDVELRNDEVKLWCRTSRPGA